MVNSREDIFANIEDEENTEALEQFSEEKKNKNLIKIGALGAGALILVCSIVGIIVVSQSEDKVDSVSIEQRDGQKSAISENAVAADIILEEKFPVELPVWGSNSYSNQDKGILRSQLYEQYSKTPLISTTMPLSSELLGYHMGGEMDDYQVLITKEEVVASTGEYIERIVNPLLGEWSDYQYSTSNANENFPVSTVADMFTPDFFERNADKEYKDYMPFYADWNADNYGIDNLSDFARWYGEVGKIEANMINENSGNAELFVKVDVTYRAWLDNGQKVSKKARLELDIVQGHGSEERPILIDGARLIFV